MTNKLPDTVLNVGQVVAAIMESAPWDGKPVFTVTCRREVNRPEHFSYSTHTSVTWSEQEQAWRAHGNGNYDMTRRRALADMAERAGISTAGCTKLH